MLMAMRWEAQCFNLREEIGVFSSWQGYFSILVCSNRYMWNIVYGIVYFQCSLSARGVRWWILPDSLLSHSRVLQSSEPLCQLQPHVHVNVQNPSRARAYETSRRFAWNYGASNQSSYSVYKVKINVTFVRGYLCFDVCLHLDLKTFASALIVSLFRFETSFEVRNILPLLYSVIFSFSTGVLTRYTWRLQYNHLRGWEIHYSTSWYPPTNLKVYYFGLARSFFTSFRNLFCWELWDVYQAIGHMHRKHFECLCSALVYLACLKISAAEYLGLQTLTCWRLVFSFIQSGIRSQTAEKFISEIITSLTTNHRKTSLDRYLTKLVHFSATLKSGNSGLQRCCRVFHSAVAIVILCCTWKYFITCASLISVRLFQSLSMVSCKTWWFSSVHVAHKDCEEMKT